MLALRKLGDVGRGVAEGAQLAPIGQGEGIVEGEGPALVRHQAALESVNGPPPAVLIVARAESCITVEDAVTMGERCACSGSGSPCSGSSAMCGGSVVDAMLATARWSRHGEAGSSESSAAVA